MLSHATQAVPAAEEEPALHGAHAEDHPPAETVNVAAKRPKVVKKLNAKLDMLIKK